MRNERIFLIVFLFLSSLFLINPLKNFVSSFFVDYLYMPFFYLKERIESLRTWEEEKKVLLVRLKAMKGDSIFPVQKFYYEPLFPPHFIIFTKPQDFDSNKNLILQEDNLVGVVEKVKKNVIVGRTIFSPGFKIGVIDKRSKVIGVLKGEGTLILELSYIPYWADVKEGDTLLTSGIGGIFPPGIPVGTIYSIAKPESEVFLKIKVKSFFDPSKFSFFIVK